MSTSANTIPVVEMKNVVKRFGTITALKKVDFRVDQAQVWRSGR
jgi:ABC-type sugar transport system ATPase subunit